MLDNNTITLTEAIFLVLDSDYVNNFVVNMIKEHIYKENFEQHCYLDWLLNRWIHIRTHKYDLPRRKTELKKNKGLSYKYKNGDWYCINCGYHSFAKHNFCRRCGTMKQ